MSIPRTFAAKKSAIVAALATPKSEYADLSPKGSVDEAIAPLIELLNGLDGVVTTSSCAGRASVFVEGEKSRPSDGDTGVKQTGVPGGKGRGGRWLFVTHDAAGLADIYGALRREGLDLSSTARTTSATRVGSREDGGSTTATSPSGDVSSSLGLYPAPAVIRLVKFQFEPMILHVSAASLSHARPLLAAALAAGFRESGLQSLGDPGAYEAREMAVPGVLRSSARSRPSPASFPTLGIRSAGLGLSGVIGYLDHHGAFRALVDESYLTLMTELARERFAANRARMERFEMAVSEKMVRKNTDGQGTHRVIEDMGMGRGKAEAPGLELEGRSLDPGRAETGSGIVDLGSGSGNEIAAMRMDHGSSRAMPGRSEGGIEYEGMREDLHNEVDRDSLCGPADERWPREETQCGMETEDLPKEHGGCLKGDRHSQTQHMQAESHWKECRAASKESSSEDHCRGKKMRGKGGSFPYRSRRNQRRTARTKKGVEGREGGAEVTSQDGPRVEEVEQIFADGLGIL